MAQSLCVLMCQQRAIRMANYNAPDGAPVITSIEDIQRLADAKKATDAATKSAAKSLASRDQVAGKSLRTDR